MRMLKQFIRALRCLGKGDNSKLHTVECGVCITGTYVSLAPLWAIGTMWHPHSAVPELQGEPDDITREKCRLASDKVRAGSSTALDLSVLCARWRGPSLSKTRASALMLSTGYLDRTCKCCCGYYAPLSNTISSPCSCYLPHTNHPPHTSLK